MLALAEDLGHGDITSETLIPHELDGRAIILAKARGVLAGGEVASKVFHKVDPSLKVSLLIEDGSPLKHGDIIAEVSGRVISILEAERVVLNFLQRLSGTASETARYVARIRGFPAKIYDTRKTTPGLRILEKYAVRMGGGQNHRIHLGDGILIKDNHLAALRARGVSFKDIVAKARGKAPAGLQIEVEVTTIQEAVQAVEAGADIVLLDNMSLAEMRRTVDMLKGRVRFEASGGIRLRNVREVAALGVDIISIGALTHSVKALDISIELDPESVRLT